MKYHFLLLFITGAWADAPSQRVGCENNPCQHQCVDTTDSYFCQCFENYDLHTDLHSCLHKNAAVQNTIYQGCWQDEDSARDLPYNIWTHADDASISTCIHDCNARGFDFAGLQNGIDCWCGNTYQRAYDTGVCDITCPGSPGQICGGATTNSIYKINRDERYMGCYTENPSDPDLTVILWGPTDGRSVDECITTCSTQGYSYSGASNGGQCGCGNSFGRHGAAGEGSCDVPCYNGYSDGNCGGETTNAIYRVVKGVDLSGKVGLKPYHDESNRATMVLNSLFVYPNSLGLYTERVLLYASDTVNTVLDDLSCTDSDCYGSCSSIQTPPTSEDSTDLILRLFYVKLSEIAALVEHPDSIQRVYVFAQTLYIDQSVDFPWSMYIRARQIIINYAANPTLTFVETGPVFGVDIDSAVIYGLPSDLPFQKLSLLCAQMLISSSETEDHVRLGWNILDDMARDHAYNSEQQNFLDNVRATRVAFTSLGRRDMHWAPYYTNSYYVSSLEEFERSIGQYYNTYQALIGSITNCASFVSNAHELLNIWTSAIVFFAEIQKNSISDVIAVSEEVYQGILSELQSSIDNFLVASQVFEQGIESVANQIVRQAMLGLVQTTSRMTFGQYPAGAEMVQGLIIDASGGSVTIDFFDVTVETLTKAVEQINLYNSMTDSIIATEDYERYIGIVEHVAGLNDTIKLWTNFKQHISEILTHPDFSDIPGALEYMFACYDLANWEDATNRAMVEYAANMRRFIAVGASLNTKSAMLDRYTGYVEGVQQDCSNTFDTAYRFAEQHYDIMIELNNQLIQFCQAHYYEEMDICPANTMPNFAASIPDLLDSITRAKEFAESFTRTNEAFIDVNIMDEPDAVEGCTDVKSCPLAMFKQSRTLHYELPLNNRRFDGLDVFLVNEIEVYLPGAFSTDSSVQSVRLSISSAGPFSNRLDTVVNTFLSRPLSGLLFQYNLDSGVIELHADLYQADNNQIYHMSPFTTWLITLPDRSDSIDISQVEYVQMVFHGTYAL